MACATRRAAPISVLLASWLNCAKMRSSWTRWRSGTASSARRCDTSCTGANFSHHCACNPVDHSHGLKIFPFPSGRALVQLPDLGSVFLACGPEQDFVDVHVLRLADRERHYSRERFSGYRTFVALM